MIISFTKCFYYENITSELDRNPKFIKISSEFPDFDVYDYKFSDLGEFCVFGKNRLEADFIRARIIVYQSKYIFVSTDYSIGDSGTDIVDLGNTVYRISHNMSSIKAYPDKEIALEIFKTLPSSKTIAFFQPYGNTVKRIDVPLNDFNVYQTIPNEDNAKIFSYVFYYKEFYTAIENYSDSDIQGLKNAVHGNVADYSVKSECNITEINDFYTIIPAATGLGLLQTKYLSLNQSKNIDMEQKNIEKLYFKYLEILYTKIHFEIKSKEFNSQIDTGEYDDVDGLLDSVRKEMRKAVQIKYKIPNCLKLNSLQNVFYGKYLTAIKFDETITGFIEICKSFEQELKSKIAEREEAHEKYFDKLLSVIGVFAIISAFKDGSDLILSMIETVKNGGLLKLNDISVLISILSPVLCVVVIFVLVRKFKGRR